VFSILHVDNQFRNTYKKKDKKQNKTKQGVAWHGKEERQDADEKIKTKSLR
jgi:hypothetical protein